mgnify:CR=1 FL=1
MNDSLAVFLLNDNARSVMATYEDDKYADATMFKTFDQDIDVDDYVIVPTDTRHKMTVCKITEVDVDIDFDSRIDCKWIIGTIELSDHELVLKQEQQAISAIRSAEKSKKRRELKEAMFADQEEVIKALPISSVSDAAE